MTLGLILAIACSGDDPGDTGAAATATTAATTESGPQPAALASPSGDWPDFSASGVQTFQSSGEERTVNILIPEDVAEDAPLVFFFHGLVGTHMTPSEYFATALGLQQIADDTGAIVVLPQSRIQVYLAYELYMWEVMNADELDLVMIDDLRACASDQRDIDLHRVSAMGFSGGALFTTVLARERADTLASVVEMSGGSDIDTDIFPETISEYGTPAWTVPALLSSGGEDDVWPGHGLVIVDFQAATDSLQASLGTDGHFVVRCQHDYGHTVTNDIFDASTEFVLAHRYGETSPYIKTGIDDWSRCEVASR